MKAKADAEPGLKSQLDDIAKRQLELKKELDDIQKKQSKLSQKITNLDKDVAQITSRTQPAQNSIVKRIQRSYRKSKPLFIMFVLSVLTVLAMVIAAAFRNIRLEYLFLDLEFLIWAVIVAWYSKKHRQLMLYFIVALALFAISIYVTNRTLVWNLIFAGLGILALGFAIYSFSSGERVENRLNEIYKEVTELRKSPDPQEGVEQKPRADK